MRPSGPTMPPSITEALKALGKRVLEAYILTPLMAVLPPATLWLFTRDFVTSSHVVSGPVGLHEMIPAGSTLRDHQFTFDLPPGVVDDVTSFQGRVGLVDNFGAWNWGAWETWEQVPTPRPG